MIMNSGILTDGKSLILEGKPSWSHPFTSLFTQIKNMLIVIFSFFAVHVDNMLGDRKALSFAWLEEGLCSEHFNHL